MFFVKWDYCRMYWDPLWDFYVSVCLMGACGLFLPGWLGARLMAGACPPGETAPAMQPKR